MTPGQLLAQSFETCDLEAYPDSRGIWTIGWGHTGKDVYEGLTWTQAQADEAFEHDWDDAQVMLETYSPGIVVGPLGSLDALTDFVFNVGIGNYRTSTLAKFVNQADWQAVKVEMLRWDHTGDQVSAGLERRRAAEAALIQA